MAIAEGKMFGFEGVESIRTEYLETFEFNEPNQVVEISSPEFSAVCPFSGLPDIAKVIIRYRPKGKALELKALKYYYTSFRNVGLYQEGVTKRIHDDLEKCLRVPVWIQTVYNTRGGLNVICEQGEEE